MEKTNIFSTGQQKIFDSLPSKFQQKILDSLEEIQKNPFQGKSLMGDFAGKYSFRCWPYRIIYSIRKKELIIEVLHITHRQSAYK